MLALSERERRFVWAYLLNALTDGKPNGAQAARDAGYSDKSEGCKVKACLALQRDDVLDAMQEVAGRQLRGLAIPAVVAVSRLLDKQDHPEHRKAAEMVLNRVGLADRVQIDVNHTGEVTVNHTDAAIADLERLLALQVPRAKLEEIFGFSGLTRYERMLAARGGPKVIEHQPND